MIEITRAHVDTGDMLHWRALLSDAEITWRHPPRTPHSSILQTPVLAITTQAKDNILKFPAVYYVLSKGSS